ncbi:MAG: transcriptional regulator [Gammaproteobacteria bacterium]|nr:MAG: transcriptional regulator [Gammaproteobacteria bacterium]
MSIKHHLDEATLFSYVAGAVGQGVALVVACHLSVCEHCRNRVRKLETIGGALLEEGGLSAVSDSSLQNVLDRLDAQSMEVPKMTPMHHSEVPLPLANYVGDSLEEVPWKKVVSGLWVHDLPSQGEGVTRLLRVAPGKTSFPHTHRGSELTQLLRGSYSDDVGRFSAGDVADLDDRITHQPLVDSDHDCICLIATEFPLRYTTLMGKLAQPLLGL